MKVRRIVIISDFQDGIWSGDDIPSVQDFRLQWADGSRGSAPSRVRSMNDVQVDGGYLERLPLAALKGGFADCAEIWTHWRGADPPQDRTDKNCSLLRRAFRMNGPEAPFASNDMLGHIAAFGPPHILCVWGLGVSEEIILACRDSFKIYNSIDAPALRVPTEVSRHFDLAITSAQWQSDAVRSRHPNMRTTVMPIGPEFASDLTFRPLNLPKTYDVIYVAAAQAYKRHDILFEALAKLPQSLRTLCVFGYGDLVHDLRDHADRLGVDVDFIGPPGVPLDEVNRLMNQSRIGVVCGVDDGAPAILTEYMLAGIPVLANSALRCGLQYITPQTGRTATADYFHEGIRTLLMRADNLRPRDVVLANWTWPHSICRLRNLIKAR
jgi:glycosyltransferase involved in cell wall biosynthesis